ncbi:sulfatase-like hydrolase/transferase [Mangrovibacterium sp.]|uniref:sulfatase-like hydrolase/transferase n=1 Tax=Mangrovibacterium sp. TaxID=1961364 RepID=UPI0035671263
MKNQNNLKWYLSGLTIAFLGTSSFANGKAKEKDNCDKPNILLILTDDLGYNDVGFNGSTDIKTPALDQLAKNGVVFTSAYVSHPFCGPSRASIMTGRYPHVIGTPYNLRDDGTRPNLGVPVSETYISNVMQEAGYYTSVVGKWHLGFAPQYHPNNRGFDEFYGFLAGGHDYFPDQFKQAYEKQLSEGRHPIREYIRPLVHNQDEVEETEYVTDALSREAVRIVNDAAERKQPFFMYLAYNAPHVPLQAKKEDLEKFADIADVDRRTYAAMVYAVDRGVEQIVESLKKNGQFENTLIVFLSDNGGNTDHGASNDPLKGMKGDAWEGGYRTPMFFHYPNKLKAGMKFDTPVTSLDFYPTFAKIAGAKIPEAKKMDGKDMMGDLINGETNLKGRPVYLLRYREGYADVGMRIDDWKITRMGNEPWNLFKISDDLGEKKDMSYRHPDKLKEMVEMTEEWSKTHIRPLWVYSQKDLELWNSGVLPGYEGTFEVEKLVAPPSAVSE